MSKLQDYFPTFEQLNAGRRDLVLPEITDQKLRDELMENAALSSDILKLVLKGLHIDPNASLADPKTGSALTVLCTVELPTLTLTIGAAAFSNQLAMHAANDLGALERAGIERPVIRQALRFRSFSFGATELNAIDPDALRAEGNQCLRCWLEAQSDDVAKVIKLRLPVVTPSNDSASQNKARVQVAQAILDDMASRNEDAA